jgi:hypothetical protein
VDGSHVGIKRRWHAVLESATHQTLMHAERFSVRRHHVHDERVLIVRNVFAQLAVHDALRMMMATPFRVVSVMSSAAVKYSMT